MEDHIIASELESLASQTASLARQLEGLRAHYHAPLEQKYDGLKSATDELKTQLVILLGNINGICERLDRLEQAHGELERHVLDMLTNTLPSSTDRITQLEHQVKDHVQSEIDRLESKLNEHGERLERACRRIEVTDR